MDLEVKCVFFADWVVQGGKEVMSNVMQDLAERWRGEGKFKENLDGGCS